MNERGGNSEPLSTVSTAKQTRLVDAGDLPPT
jgi:hypothetical protein